MGLPDANELLDPPDEFWQRYLESCRRLGIEPVPCERARELVREWAAAFERGGKPLHWTQDHPRRRSASIGSQLG